MVEFDIKCRQCRKPITLRVRDEQTRTFFQDCGAFCEVCHKPGYRPAPTLRAA